VVAAQLVEASPGPKYAFLERAVGQRVTAVRRHGKFLLLPLERRGAAGPPDELIIHLGMTGAVSTEEPAGHLRVRLELDGPPPQRLFFRDVRRFGRLLVVPGGDYGTLPTLREAGPDALSSAFTVASLRGALARSGVAIKTALMSQRPVAGIGNIYADEALWRARLHPQRPARSLRRREVEALHDALRDVLEASLAAQGTTLHDYRTVGGGRGAYLERLAVYGRTGRACPRCGGLIERIVVGARGTHVCPRCQPRPRQGRAARRR
jgi:formamidopyrimidine-DNA glycosylase